MAFHANIDMSMHLSKYIWDQATTSEMGEMFNNKTYGPQSIWKMSLLTSGVPSFHISQVIIYS